MARISPGAPIRGSWLSRARLSRAHLSLVHGRPGMEAVRWATSFRQALLCSILLCEAILSGPQDANAVTKDSPEVRKLIEDGKKYLGQHTDHRLGGKCLVALAFLKDGESLTHPRIQEALEACQNTSAEAVLTGDVYSNGLAIIFLAELDGGKNKEVISRFAGAMASRQKVNGAWGYGHSMYGDTSQTQYAALSYWELLRIGSPLRVEKVDAGANWLLRTQDPSGAWGYQGKTSDDGELIAQSDTSLSMMAAGMGGTMIFGHMLDILKPGGITEAQQPLHQLPTALRRANTKAQMRTLSGTRVDHEKMKAAIDRGRKWYDENFSAKLIERWGQYPCYLLYSLERYKSFEELFTGNAPDEPEWYEIGYRFLKEHQSQHGGWHSHSEDPCATAFAVLFLLRSTQGIVNRASLGEGTLVGSRGLSADLSRMKMRRGRLVTTHKPTEVDKLLGMLEGSDNEDLDALLRDPAALQVNNAGAEQARRLQQIVKSGLPEARVLAVRALSRLRNLDHVPTLLYAMTDFDNRVVREARNGLRFVSRRFGGFGLADNFDDSQRYNALDKWKAWYRRLEPDAIILP